MKKIIAFSKYIYYSVGGAEKSMLEILKKKSENQYEITLIGVDNLKSFNSDQHEILFAEGWKKSSITLNYQLKRFSYFEYFLNKNNIISYFKKIEPEAELYTYGFYAPAAVKGYSGQATVFLRNETDLGINDNYYTGIKKILKFFHILLEYPFYLIYKSDLKNCYAKSKLIFNSQWMASECKKRFGFEGRVEYPSIDLDLLKKNFLSNSHIQEKGIVFVGDAEIKGLSIVKKIADLLKNQNFYVFSRHVSEKVVSDNITYMAWTTDSSVPFKYAKLLIVPSIWNEAFGRVSIEAQSLGIPVLVSNRGGLPETVKFNDQYIVHQYLNPRQWVQKINEILVK